MSGMVTIGETMGLFRADEIGSIAQVDAFTLAIGGAESNVAIGVSRLGAAATWIGRIGADGLGDRVRRELLGEGVAVHAVVDEQARTGLMLKERRTADLTRVAYYRAGSAGSRLSPDDLDADLIRTAAVLHVTGITPALSASAAATVREAVRIAIAADVAVSFDVNHRSTLWDAADAAPVYRELASAATIVFAGADEAALVVGDGPPAELAERLAALGPAQVVIKLGPDGCFARLDGATYAAPAVPIRPIDTVGAGDAFVAGYLAEFMAGAGPQQRLDTAVRAGAFACLGPGDWESYARRSELPLLDGGDPVSR